MPVVAMNRPSGLNRAERIGPAEICAWLSHLEQTHPFSLTGCSFEHVAGRFLHPVDDAETLAKRLFEFCPDSVD